MRRLFKPLLVVTVTLALVLSAWGTLTYASTFGAKQAKQSALTPERAAAYRDALLSWTQNSAYYAPPREDAVLRDLRLELGPDASMEQLRELAAQRYRDFAERNEKLAGPNPLAYLGRLKAQEAALAAGGDDPGLTGTPQILTVMANFTGTTTVATGPGGDPIAFMGACLTDTTVYPESGTLDLMGASFNEIPDPTGTEDNSLPWISPDSYTGGFSEEFYQEFMFGTTGYTDTIRPDLPNPWDGGMGYNFTGVTFRNYYAEQSRGAYIPEGDVIETTLPTTQADYGADTCYFDDEGNLLTAGNEDDYFRPGWEVARDTAIQINEEFPGASTGENPDFNWMDWDQEDVFDYDDDGNFNEPDGYVDHFFIIYAGVGSHSGGGALGETQIWAHSWAVDQGSGEGPATLPIGGYRVLTDSDHPMGGVWVFNYTVSDEANGLGVFSHEYGHDIGLPDNYAYDSSDPNTGHWDVMSQGSYAGELSGMRPVGFTVWDKEFFDWSNLQQIDVPAESPEAAAAAGGDYIIAQQSKPGEGMIDGLRVNLPDQVELSPLDPFEGEGMWWSERGHNRTESLMRSFTPQAGETVTVSAQMAYFIEEDWDYLYWEVSTDGETWQPLDVYADDADITTDADPNGTNDGNGITGFLEEWTPVWAVITPSLATGDELSFRFRYEQDTATQFDGVFLDNISIDGSASGNIAYDDAEGENTWELVSEGLDEVPWRIFAGGVINSVEHYYLVEWRNAGEEFGADGEGNGQEAFETAGFDAGLNRTYWIAYIDAQGNTIKSPFFMNTPGMVVWYVNYLYGTPFDNNNMDEFIFNDYPSWGAKARVLVADANPQPYVVEDEDGDRQIGGTRSAFDGSYTLHDRPSFELASHLGGGEPITTTVPGAMAVPAFRDRIGTTPGMQGAYQGDNLFNYFIDYDAGVVLPTRNEALYYPAWDWLDSTGNPGVNAYGVNLEVMDRADDGTWGSIRYTWDDDTVFVDTHTSADTVQVGDTVTYTISLKDASGTRDEDLYNWTFDAELTTHLPEGAAYVEDSLTLTDGPWSTTSTVSMEDDTITWRGELGGNPLGVPDAMIQYAVTYEQAGFSTSTANLTVQQETITDTYRNNGDPFLWPRQSDYSSNAVVAVQEPTAISLDTVSGQSADVGVPFALVGTVAGLLVAVPYIVRRRRRA